MSSEPLKAHPSILALGYSEASMLLRQSPPGALKALISIHGKHEFSIDAPDVAQKLVLCFDDTEVVNLANPASTYGAWARHKWAKEMGRPLTPPTIEDAKAIIKFAHTVADLEATVLCHCQGGVSRSPAAALLCLATWTGSGQEQYCVEELLRIRPCAAPHRDIVSWGDSLLGREGKLTQTLIDALQK